MKEGDEKGWRVRVRGSKCEGGGGRDATERGRGAPRSLTGPRKSMVSGEGRGEGTRGGVEDTEGFDGGEKVRDKWCWRLRPMDGGIRVERVERGEGWGRPGSFTGPRRSRGMVLGIGPMDGGQRGIKMEGGGREGGKTPWSLMKASMRVLIGAKILVLKGWVRIRGEGEEGKGDEGR